MSNITIVMLPGGNWQLWDGHNGINGKSEKRDYSERIFWIRENADSYIAQTGYYGAEFVKKIIVTDWPYAYEDHSVL